MSAEGIDIVRRAFSAFVDNDYEAYFALASKEIEVDSCAEEPGARPSPWSSSTAAIT